MARYIRQALACLASVAAIVVVALPDAPSGWTLPAFTGVCALAAIAVGIRLFRPSRPLVARLRQPEPWSIIALGVALGCLAQFWGLGASPVQSLAALAAATFVSGAGVAMMLRDRSLHGLNEHLSEAAIAIFTFGFAGWAWFLQPKVQDGRLDLTVGLLLVTVVVFSWAALLLTAHLLFTFDLHPFAFRWLCIAALARTGGSLMAIGFVLEGANALVGAMRAFAIVEFSVTAIAALHASMGRHDEPPTAAVRTSDRWRTVFAATLVSVGPVVMALSAKTGHQLSNGAMSVGSGITSLLVVAHLVRLVHARAWTEHQAQHDDLTGLPNRVLFYERVSAALSVARRTGGKVAVMYLDLDRFKTVNDSLGHAAGNQLLEQVAQRLNQSVSRGDTVARLSGDEFTVLLPHVRSADEAIVVSERLLRAFGAAFAVGKRRELFVTTSIGIAVSGADDIDAEALLTNADTALYQAKDRGRNTYQLYRPEMNLRAQKRLVLESTLHTAIERKELVVHYQPRVDLRTGKIVGVEALVRWTHPQLGVLSPAEFIGLAEETGLIVPIGEWVLETAAAQNQAWMRSGFPRLVVAVNLSARQFQGSSVSSMVARVLRTTGLPPDTLELELTESLAMSAEELALDTLLDLKEMGVSCSIDDFGTGYSSLTTLTRFPFDRLKIDKSFVRQIGDQPSDEVSIVPAIIAMAHSLDLEVVAEGVENANQVSFLVDHECDQMQGYLFSKPIPADQLETLLMLEQVAPGQGRLLLPRQIAGYAEGRPA